MNYRLLFNTALLAGEIMLRNGAETYRVEDTINRILSMSEFKVVESFVTPTGIFATLDDPSIEMITFVKRVADRTIHLSKVALANDISRKFCTHQITLEEAYERLKKAQEEPPYKGILITFSIALASGFFSIVFGGTIKDFIVSIINGFALASIQYFLNQYGVSKFFVDLFGGIVIAFVSALLVYLVPIGYNLDIIIVGSIMPLVPGVAITNAIRDTLQGDLISGISRGLEAVIIAISIALGVGVGLSIYTGLLGGGLL